MSSRLPAAELGLLLVVVIWGFNFAVTKDAFDALSPFAFNAVRLSLSTALVGGIAWWHCRRSNLPFLPGAEFMELLWLGLLGHGLYQVLFVSGLAATTSGNAALMLASAPVWTALYESLIGKLHIPRLAWIGLGVALSGTAVLTILGAQVSFNAETLEGDVMVGLSAVMWGAYTARSRPLIERRPPIVVLFWSLLAAQPLLWILGGRDVVESLGALRSGGVWFALFWSGILSTGVAYMLWNVGIRALGAAATSAWNNLVPVVAVIVGAVWLKEPIGSPQIVGGVLVVGGVLLTRRALRVPKVSVTVPEVVSPE